LAVLLDEAIQILKITSASRKTVSWNLTVI
jgi:hypothetical protein